MPASTVRHAKPIGALCNFMGGGRWVDVGSFDETDTARVPPFEAVELPIGRLFLPRGGAPLPDGSRH